MATTTSDEPAAAATPNESTAVQQGKDPAFKEGEEVTDKTTMADKENEEETSTGAAEAEATASTASSNDVAQTNDEDNNNETTTTTTDDKATINTPETNLPEGEKDDSSEEDVDDDDEDDEDEALSSPTSVDEGESFDASLNSPERAAERAAQGTATAANASSTKEPKTTGLKVLFLSSDTGGGHRASAESLAKQFQILFPGSTYDLLDVVEEDFGPPYNSLVSAYKHLSAHPSQWKLLYTISNSRGFEMIADAHFKLMFERAIRKRIKKYAPDVVVSVHPMMTNVPVLSCKRISNETGRHLPMFTVVTDLGSAHCLWFANGVEKMFVGSEQVKKLAKARGKVPEEKLVLSGLPIRHDFAVQAQAMGERMSPAGQEYQYKVRAELHLPYTHRKTLLLMGGGEGVGSLSNIVDALYCELTNQGIDALILVVCGRNEKLRLSLETRDWAQVYSIWQSAKNHDGMSKSLMSFGDTCGAGGIASSGCIEGGTVTGSIRRMLSTSTMTMGNVMTPPDPVSPSASSKRVLEEKKADDVMTAALPLTTDAEKEDNNATSTDPPKAVESSGSASDAAQSLVQPSESEDMVIANSNENTKAAGDVHVAGLGFVTRMAEYMVAADILVTKAGPGTISEAAALSLPVMLTSFLPGQEEGNIDFVIDGGFGAYVNDSDPVGIAEELCMWLTDDERRAGLSAAAKAHGAPYAARDIVQQIGDSTLKWREINEEKAAAEAIAGKDSPKSSKSKKKKKHEPAPPTSEKQQQ